MNLKYNLEIITGPMFAGKTTKIIELYSKYNPKETLVLNHSFDNRYFGDNNVISSHIKECIPCNKFNSCDDIQKYINTLNNFDNITTIFIDECQFFTEINQLCNLINNNYKNIKNIYLAGLNLDASGNIFNNEFNELFKYANTVYYLEARCYKCNNPAQYSICLINKNFSQDNVLVGDKEIYQPSCKEHINFELK